MSNARHAFNIAVQFVMMFSIMIVALISCQPEYVKRINSRKYAKHLPRRFCLILKCKLLITKWY